RLAENDAKLLGENAGDDVGRAAGPVGQHDLDRLRGVLVLCRGRLAERKAGERQHDRDQTHHLHLHPPLTLPERRLPVAHSGSSTFTSLTTFFQSSVSALFHSRASAIEEFGTGLIICFLNASFTGSESSACTTALCSVSSTSGGVAAGA